MYAIGASIASFTNTRVDTTLLTNDNLYYYAKDKITTAAKTKAIPPLGGSAT